MLKAITRPITPATTHQRKTRFHSRKSLRSSSARSISSDSSTSWGSVYFFSSIGQDYLKILTRVATIVVSEAADEAIDIISAALRPVRAPRSGTTISQPGSILDV